MVDPERLRRVLQHVTDDLALLAGYARSDRAALLGDVARLGHIKYLYVTAIEGCIDAAHHVCAAEGWGPPDTNADAMLVLGRHRVLSDDLAVRMATAVRFRNLLVHRYTRVDDRRVVEHLDDLPDLDRYVTSVSLLLGC